MVGKKDLIRKSLAVGIILLLILINVSVISIEYKSELIDNYNIKSSNGVNHSSIYINGNMDFTPENGVTGGSGTESDPFIIEGWNIINISLDFGIKINNTDSFFVVRNCSFDPSFNICIYVLNSVNGCVESCIIADSAQFGYGIFMNNCSSFILCNNEIISNTYGIQISSSNNITVHNNKISAEILSSFDGIKGDKCHNLIVSNNTVSHDYNEGIVLSGSHIIIKNNHVSGYSGLGTTGIQITGNNNHVHDNNIRGAGSGVGIRSNSGSSFNISFENNSVMYNSLGMQIQGSHFHIDHNVIQYNDKGLTLWISDNSTVENNTVTFNNNPDNEGFGIAISWDSKNNRILNNDLSNNLIGIIIAGSSNNIFSWNNINCKNYGIHLKNSQNIHISANNDIHNNLIVGGDYGLYLTEGSTENMFSFNEITGTTYGVYLIDKSSRNTFTKNNFLDNMESYAFFELRLLYQNNLWEENYWGASKILPKVIFGRTGIFLMKIPWFNFDWHPASEPYNIGV